MRNSSFVNSIGGRVMDIGKNATKTSFKPNSLKTPPVRSRRSASPICPSSSHIKYSPVYPLKVTKIIPKNRVHGGRTPIRDQRALRSIEDAEPAGGFPAGSPWKTFLECTSSAHKDTLADTTPDNIDIMKTQCLLPLQELLSCADLATLQSLECNVSQFKEFILLVSANAMKPALRDLQRCMLDMIPSFLPITLAQQAMDVDSTPEERAMIEEWGIQSLNALWPAMKDILVQYCAGDAEKSLLVLEEALEQARALFPYMGYKALRELNWEYGLILDSASYIRRTGLHFDTQIPQKLLELVDIMAELRAVSHAAEKDAIMTQLGGMGDNLKQSIDHFLSGDFEADGKFESAVETAYGLLYDLKFILSKNDREVLGWNVDGLRGCLRDVMRFPGRCDADIQRHLERIIQTIDPKY